ncbi:MAG: phytanoyl-CoA dioxygenase family protein [Planctomycetota bacterium]
MGILTKEQHAQFQQDGYLLIDPEIPMEIIDGVVSDLDGQYDQPLNGDGVLPPCRIQDAWKSSENAHRIAVWPKILQVLQELYQREPLPFQTLNFPTGTIQPAHSDAIHFSSAPADYMSGVWVGLEEIDEENGPVFYYPGSHKLPSFDMADVGVDPIEENYRDYEAFMSKVVKKFKLEKKQATMPKGHVFIWSAGLIHGGDERTDLFRSRHSMVTHVYYADCRYWTPMFSKGLNVHWREPQFIPKDVEGRDPSKYGKVYKKGVAMG